MNKFQGEAESTMRALFVVARILQPSVLFFDEIDAMLAQRKDDDGGCTDRVKAEFLQCMVK